MLAAPEQLAEYARATIEQASNLSLQAWSILKNARPLLEKAAVVADILGRPGLTHFGLRVRPSARVRRALVQAPAAWGISLRVVRIPCDPFLQCSASHKQK
jgi:hypothetical protein